MNENKQIQQFMSMSFSHKNTDIALREKLNFDNSQIVPFLQKLKECSDIKEAILLATCNRVEIYLSVFERRAARDFVFSALSEFKGVESKKLREICDIALNQGAIYHIFCVSSSLDSVVVGETQITGQLKVAYKIAFDNMICGKDMTRLMHYAFKCAAAVRQQTGISSSSISVASAALNFAYQNLQSKNISTESKNILIIGCGEMGRLSAKHAITKGANITLVNRHIDKANNLYNEIKEECTKIYSNIKVEEFKNLANFINDFDIVVVATSSNSPIITQELLEKKENFRIFLDLSIPRNIATNLDSQVLNLSVFCVDDLSKIVESNKAKRESSAKLALKIIEQFSVDFFKWLQTLGIDPVIKQMRALAKQSCMKEIDRAIKKGFIPKEYEKSLEKILHGAFNTFLHNPTMRLKAAGENAYGDPIIEAIKNIFDISDDIVMLEGYKCEKDNIIY